MSTDCLAGHLRCLLSFWLSNAFCIEIESVMAYCKNMSTWQFCWKLSLNMNAFAWSKVDWPGIFSISWYLDLKCISCYKNSGNEATNKFSEYKISHKQFFFSGLFLMSMIYCEDHVKVFTNSLDKIQLKLKQFLWCKSVAAWPHSQKSGVSTGI